MDDHFPRCTPDGRFEPVQCVSGSCYCVKKNGREVAGTRLDTPVRTPNCAQPGESKTPQICLQRGEGRMLVYPSRLSGMTIPHLTDHITENIFEMCKSSLPSPSVMKSVAKEDTTPCMHSLNGPRINLPFFILLALLLLLA